MKTSMAVSLFGGALFAAGVVQTADAATWDTRNYIDGSSHAHVFEFVSPFGANYQTNYGIPSSAYAGPATYVIGTASAYATVTTMSVSAQRTDSLPVYTGIVEATTRFPYLTVTNTTDILLTWDFTSSPYSYAYVWDSAKITQYFGAYSGAGSAVVTLLPGIEYAIVLQISARNGGESGFATAQIIPIPAQGGVALLAMAGFIGHRRRRRH